MSKSLEELLSELPEQSCARIVRDWITNTDSKPDSPATKNCKSKNPIIQKNSFCKPTKNKAMSILNSEKDSLISCSKIYQEKSLQLEKDVFILMI
jgi:hypothetical protein